MNPEEVALRALIYRECWRNNYTSLDDIITDSEIAPGMLSFLTLIAADTLGPRDWACLSVLHENGGQFVRVAREHPDFEMAEVLLHAQPPNGVQSKKPWAAPFRGKRWFEVEVYMLAVERSGTTTSHDDVGLSFSRAWRQLTGGSIDDYLNACETTEAAWG